MSSRLFNLTSPFRQCQSEEEQQRGNPPREHTQRFLETIISLSSTMRFTLHTLLACLLAAATTRITVEAFAPAAVRTLSVRGIVTAPGISSVQPSSTWLRASTTTAASAEEPEEVGGGTATISQYVRAVSCKKISATCRPCRMSLSAGRSDSHDDACLVPFLRVTEKSLTVRIVVSVVVLCLCRVVDYLMHKTNDCPQRY